MSLALLYYSCNYTITVAFALNCQYSRRIHSPGDFAERVRWQGRTFDGVALGAGEKT